jgi:hypothetical protein
MESRSDGPSGAKIACRECKTPTLHLRVGSPAWGGWRRVTVQGDEYARRYLEREG